MMKIATPIKAMEEQTRRNMEMFQNAMRLFTPFPPAAQRLSGRPGRTGAGRRRRKKPTTCRS